MAESGTPLSVEPISYLAVHDINNDGWAMYWLLTVWEAEVFLSWEGSFDSFWRASGVRHFRSRY